MPARLDAVRLLSLDAHGRVLDWMSWQDATCLYVRGAVAWTLGDPCLHVHGGTCRATGAQSVLELHPIVAARGHARPHALDPTPALTNAALFARDQHLCLYCGRELTRQQLTRDHVVPLSKGGRDIWENVVAACFHCNSRKGGRTPQQASMPLLAVPYRPSWIEHLILSQPQHPGRPDGVPEEPPAQAQTPFQLTEHRRFIACRPHAPRPQASQLQFRRGGPSASPVSTDPAAPRGDAISLSIHVDSSQSSSVVAAHGRQLRHMPADPAAHVRFACGRSHAGYTRGFDHGVRQWP